ncbi:MAG: hypothetical protein LBR07_03035, partial [Puniceicoccales bacterium]|nr:hypothetical protein [Puniceicoccales bacterium]
MRKFIHNSLITAALAGALATGNAIPAATGNAKVATGAAGSATAGDAAGTPAPARVAPSADAVAADRARNIRLPKNDIHYRKTRGYVED